MAEDVDRLNGLMRVAVVNDCWRLAPWADLLYACDASWWKFHHGVPAFGGQKWTQHENGGIQAGKRWGLNVVRSAFERGLSFDPAVIHQGQNSTYQLLNILMLAGVKRIILLGLDMQGVRAHWFGQHPTIELNRATPFAACIKWFESAVPDLARAGVEVINCSRSTALECFPRASLDDVLCRI